MPMTGRSLAIASSTNRTDFRRPTSIGMIAPGNNTELRSGRMGSVSGISTGCSPPALALVMDRKLATDLWGRQADLPVMTGTFSSASRIQCAYGPRGCGARPRGRSSGRTASATVATSARMGATHCADHAQRKAAPAPSRDREPRTTRRDRPAVIVGARNSLDAGQVLVLPIAAIGLTNHRSLHMALPKPTEVTAIDAVF